MTALDTSRHRAADDDDETLVEPLVVEALTEPEPRPRQPRQRLPAGAAVAIRGSVSCLLLCTWVVAYVLGISGLQQARTQAELYGKLRKQISEATAPLGGDIEPGTPVALIEAPSIKLRQVVVEGTSSHVVRHGPGHRRNTPLPGQPGVSVVYGHATAFGGPFGSITSLKKGNLIVVNTGLGQFEYQVDGVRRAKDPVPPPLAKGGSRLVLTTVEGGGWRTHWAPNHVVYVDATMVNGEARLGPPGRPTSVTTAEDRMQSDPAVFIPLVLWLQLLGVVMGVTTWMWVRWGRMQTWVVGVPVVLACVWGAVESMAQLLPNLV